LFLTVLLMKKILIMDDDEEMLSVLEVILSKHGYKVAISKPTPEIVELVNMHQPDLIILDYLMGSINGGDLCSTLHKEPTFSHLPVIIFSAYDRVFSGMGNYGCSLFLPKTADMSTLISEIQTLLN